MDDETGAAPQDNESQNPGGESEPAVVFPDPVEFAVRTLLGDFRDDILDFVRNLPDQWRRMSESQQRERAVWLSDRIREGLERCCSIIHAVEFVSIGATLDGVKIVSKGIQATLLVDRYDRRRLDLADAQGGKVTIILADAERFMGARAPVKIDPDQTPLPLEGLLTPQEMGAEAFRKGIPLEECPLVDPVDQGAWEEGWRAVESGTTFTGGTAPSEAFLAGQKAGLEGLRATENPHPPTEELALGVASDRDEWHRGWVAGWSATKGDPGPGEMSLEGAYELGRQARRHGVARVDNHFDDPDSPLHAAWTDGWDAGADDQGEDQPKRRGRPPKAD